MEFDLDSLHRLTSVTEGSNGTVGYTYDLRNAVTQVAYPNGTTVTNTYDAVGREISVTDGTGNKTALTYDPNSNLTTETLPAATKIVDTFTYDRNDQIVNIADKHAKTKLFSATYARDADGMLTSDSSAPTNAGPTYGYTALNQLCYAGSKTKAPCGSAPTTSYAYSSADNLVATPGADTQTFDPADELCWTLPTPSTELLFQRTGSGDDVRLRRRRRPHPGNPAQRTVYDPRVRPGQPDDEFQHRPHDDSYLHIQWRRRTHDQDRQRQHHRFRLGCLGRPAVAAARRLDHLRVRTRRAPP